MRIYNDALRRADLLTAALHIVIVALLVAFMVAATAAPALAAEVVLNVIYSGARNGELEPCGCSPENEFGGLARQSGYIASNREALSPFILIDAGNSMPKDTAQGRLKAEALIRAYSIMGYDAAALFKKDAAMPADFTGPLIKKEKARFFSGAAATAVERAGVTVNISLDPKARRAGMLNVLLTDLTVEELKTVDGWDVVVTSSGETIDEPERSKSGVIVAGNPRGQKLGVLALRLDGGRVASTGHRWQLLGADVKDDERVRAVLGDYDAKVAGLLKDEERKASSMPPYLGVAACAECHQPFVESWKATKHAGAFAALEKAGKSKDPECVQCHTTGFGEEGFYSMTTTPGLANVQCEMCHGQGLAHSADLSRPLGAVGEEKCRRCHTPERSPGFEFRTYREMIIHR